MSANEDKITKPKPLFDRTITYGHILTAISFVVAGTAAFFGMKAECRMSINGLLELKQVCSSFPMLWCRLPDRTSGSMLSSGALNGLNRGPQHGNPEL